MFLVAIWLDVNKAGPVFSSGTENPQVVSEVKYPMCGAEILRGLEANNVYGKARDETFGRERRRYRLLKSTAGYFSKMQVMRLTNTSAENFLESAADAMCCLMVVRQVRHLKGGVDGRGPDNDSSEGGMEAGGRVYCLLGSGGGPLGTRDTR